MNGYTKEAMEEALARLERAEQERKAKREELKRLTMDLLTFDNECIGAAIKRYILQDADTALLSETAFSAYDIIAKIKVLEWEC